MNVISVTSTGWCPNCGETHLTLLGKCTRCGAGAVAASTHESIDHVSDDLAEHRNGKETPTDLPATAASRRWLQQTQALIDSLKAQRHQAEQKEREAEEQLAELDRAIGALQSTLKHVRVPAAVTVTPRRPAALPAPRQHGQLNGRWSMAYEACIDCGRTDRKHAAHGRCQACDWQHRQKSKP